MRELEKFAEGWIRRSKQDANRVVGNVVGAEFRYGTSRDRNSHLYTLCISMIATYVPAEACWKALRAEARYRARAFAENLYDHELTKGQITLGYEME